MGTVQNYHSPSKFVLLGHVARMPVSRPPKQANIGFWKDHPTRRCPPYRQGQWLKYVPAQANVSSIDGFRQAQDRQAWRALALAEFPVARVDPQHASCHAQSMATLHGSPTKSPISHSPHSPPSCWFSTPRSHQRPIPGKSNQLTYHFEAECAVDQAEVITVATL